MTPFVKVLSEYFPTRAQSFFAARPVERYPGEPSDLIPGIEKRAEHLIQSMLPPVGKVARLAKAAGGRKAVWGEEELDVGRMTLFGVAEVLGLKLIQNDSRRVLRGQTYAKRDALQRARKKARDLGVRIPVVTRQASTKRRRRGRRGRGRRGMG